MGFVFFTGLLGMSFCAGAVTVIPALVLSIIWIVHRLRKERTSNFVKIPAVFLWILTVVFVGFPIVWVVGMYKGITAHPDRDVYVDTGETFEMLADWREEGFDYRGRHLAHAEGLGENDFEEMNPVANAIIVNRYTGSPEEENDDNGKTLYEIPNDTGYPIYCMGCEIFCEEDAYEAIMNYYENETEYVYYCVNETHDIFGTADYKEIELSDWVFEELEAERDAGKNRESTREKEITGRYYLYQCSVDGVYRHTQSVYITKDAVYLSLGGEMGKDTDYEEVYDGYRLADEVGDEVREALKWK